MTTNIVMGPPILEKWLRKHYALHHVNEISISTDPTDTIMTIMVDTEEFPEFDSELSKTNKPKVSVQHD